MNDFLIIIVHYGASEGKHSFLESEVKVVTVEIKLLLDFSALVRLLQHPFRHCKIDATGTWQTCKIWALLPVIQISSHKEFVNTRYGCTA